MNTLVRVVVAIGLAAFGFAGGCATAPNVLVINDTPAPVEAAHINVPVGMGGTADHRVIASAHLAHGDSIQLRVLANEDQGFAPRLRVTAAPGSAQWLDLQRGGWYTVRIIPAGSSFALKVEERKPPAQSDAEERQRRDIIDRPPAAFDR